MIVPNLLHARPPDPGDDAAPLAGGAGVSGTNSSLDCTFPKSALRSKARPNLPIASHILADRRTGQRATQRALVLAVIAEAGVFGATDAEIEAATGLRAQSVSPRRGELRAQGLIVNSERRRPTPRRRPAAVWVVAGPGTKP